MKRLIKEINSKTESFFKQKRSYSFQKNINCSEKLSSSNILGQNQKLKIENYVISKKLGQGTFGIVVLAKHEITGEKVAIKILDKEKIYKNSEKLRFERKIQIMKKMYHNNIVRLYNVIENYKEIFLVMEYIPGQELFDYISYKKRLTEIESCKFFQQIISGIEYLSKTKVAHRDLKPENLLIDSKKTIKIVDFGLSNTYFENELLSTACGSPCYAAPEILQGKKYKGVEVDIWSSGIILFAMLCGFLPFEDKNNQNLYKKIIKGEFYTPDYLSPNAVDILHKILNTEPSKRYNIEQIKSHPWFKMINPKINIIEGLLIDKYIIPFDEEIIKEMVQKYHYNDKIVKINIIVNKHNHITTTYYLMLKKKIRNGQETIGDMNSKLFLDYISDKNNLLAKYHFDVNRIIVERVFNDDKNFFAQENNQDKFSELKDRNNSIKKQEIKIYENNISNFTKKYNYNIKEKKNFEAKFVKINHSKNLQTIESEKNESENIKLKKINKNDKDKRNHISFRDNKNMLKGKKKFKYYIGPKNALSQKYFNSTYSENIRKNLNQTNEDISINESIQKKIQNRIHVLKENILKSMNLTNNNYTKNTYNNENEKSNENNSIRLKNSNLKSFLSSPKPFSKNIKNEKDNNIYKKLKIDNKISINETHKKNIFKKINDINSIRIVKKRKCNEDIKYDNKYITEENENYTNVSKFNSTKRNFNINNSSRFSRTPNNILRNLNNKLISEQNSIKNEKNINNYVTNNNNNINININFTNIIKNERYNKNSECLLRNNNEKLLTTNYEEINDIFRLNKFLDNSINNKKCFFNTSVSIEKGRRQTESENKNNGNLSTYSNNYRNLYDKYNKYYKQKETSSKRKIKDNQYLQIKAKNKMFNNSKVKNYKYNNSQKSIIKIDNTLKTNKLSTEKKDSTLIQKKNTNIYFSSKNAEKIRNKNLSNNKQDEKYIKTNYTRKSIKDINTKRHMFKHLKTDFNRTSNINKLSLTNINFFSNRKSNVYTLNEIKEINPRNETIKKTQLLSTNSPNKDKNNNFLNPFDLSSLIILNERIDAKKKICNFLESKNIKYKNGGNNKYICSKNDMELELQLINISNENGNRIYIIKLFHKKFISIKSKNFYYKYIPKLFSLKSYK